MDIEFDTEKRNKPLDERGLDFARADEVFAGPVLTMVNQRTDYGGTSIHHLRTVGDAPRGARLDPARRGTPHHFHEVCE